MIEYPSVNLDRIRHSISLNGFWSVTWGLILLTAGLQKCLQELAGNRVLAQPVNPDISRSPVNERYYPGCVLRVVDIPGGVPRGTRSRWWS